MFGNVKSRPGRIALGILYFFVATLFVSMPVGLLGSSNLVWGEGNQYGRVAVPGSTTLHLPAGKVDVSAALALPGRGNETPTLPLPSDLTLRVTPAGAAGHAVVTRDYGPSTNASGNGVDTQRHAFRVQISAAGDYRVSARGSLSEAGLNPQLWFGHGPPLPGNYVPLVGAILVLIGGAVWFLLLPKLGVRRRPARKRSRAPRPAGARFAVEDLNELAKLHRRGELTDAEYAAAKAKLLHGR